MSNQGPIQETEQEKFYRLQNEKAQYESSAAGVTMKWAKMFGYAFATLFVLYVIARLLSG